MFDSRQCSSGELAFPPPSIEPTLSFKTDDRYLAARLVSWAMQPFSMPGQVGERGDRLIRLAIKSGRDACQFIAENELSFFPGVEKDNSIDSVSADMLLEVLMADPSFPVFRDETVASMLDIRNEWQANLVRSSSLIHEITGLSLGDRHHDVVITHPAVPQGRFIPPDQIAWAASTSFPLANVVYLWHEILHGVLQNNDISHAIIERVADYELRHRLTNAPSDNTVESHPFLAESHAMIDSAWHDFLGARAQGQGDILQLERDLLERHLFSDL